MNFLSESDVQALGWTLVHSLWQGALVGLVCAAGLRAIPRAAPTARYAFACAMLGAIVFAGAVTFVVVREGPQASVARADVVETQEVFARSSKPQATAEVVASAQTYGRADVMQWVVWAWVLGVGVLSLWHVAGWIWLQRLRAIGADVERAQTLVERLCDRLGIARAVRLIECVRVDVPAVVGALRPVILLPIGLLTEMSPRQVEAILIHELAHIRRHDYLVNLMQTAVETLLFYHPAVWWISAQIRQERENCCDDVAVKMSGDAVGYAEALAALERSRALPMHLSLAANDGRLVERVRRVLHLPPARKNPVRSLGVALLALACGCAPLVASKDEEKKPEEKPAQVTIVERPTTQSADTVEIRGGMVTITSTTQPTGQTIRLHNGGMVTLNTNKPTTRGFMLHNDYAAREFKIIGAKPTTVPLNWNKSLNVTIDGGTLIKRRVRDFLRVVVDKQEMKLEGKVIDLASLRTKLQEIPDEKRRETVLEVSATADTTLGRFEEVFGQMIKLASEFHLAYASDVGIEREGGKRAATTKPVALEERMREDQKLQRTQREYREAAQKAIESPIDRGKAPAGGAAGKYYIDGPVPRAGSYSLPKEKITVKQAIAAAGGIDEGTKEAFVTIIRRDGEKERVFADVPYNDFIDGPQEDFYLHTNDVIQISREKRAAAPVTAPAATRPVAAMQNPEIRSLIHTEKKMELEIENLRAKGIGDKHPTYRKAVERLAKIRNMREHIEQAEKATAATTKSS